MSPLRKVAGSPGATAIITLAALTAVEYLVSISGVPAAFLWLTIIAVVAGVVLSGSGMTTGERYSSANTRL